MFVYQLRLAWLSLKRNPVLSALIVIGIAVGMGLAMSSVAIYHLQSGDPIPHKSDRLFYVQMDSWSPDGPVDDDNPEEPPTQITYMDMQGIMKSTIPSYQSGMYKTYLTVHPETEGLRPYRAAARLCYGDFFPMFDVPFRYGTGWSRAADRGPEPVVVLDAATNQKLFGGEDSVGRTLRIEDREFRIVGVLRPWRPMPKFYDAHNGAYNEVAEVFVPFGYGPEWEMYSTGNTTIWKNSGPSYQDFLQSEGVWIQMWVQLDDEQQRQEYAAFLEAYVMEQKKLGRFERPLNNRLRNVTAWLENRNVVAPETKTMLIISALFLLISSVNLIGILLGKFLARAPEVGVRRALGAGRRWVFVQHLVECALVGVIGGALGLGLSVLGVRVVNGLFQSEFPFIFDATMFLVTLGLALLSAFIAGAYPAWRVCRVQPALHLKTQ